MPEAGVGYSLEHNRFESVALPLAQQGMFGPSVFRDAREGQESESVELSASGGLSRCENTLVDENRPGRCDGQR